MDITQILSELLQNEGVDLYGFADLRDLPVEQRDGFDYGISIAFALDKDVLLGIGDGPTLAYYENYERLNKRLDALDLLVEETLVAQGFKAQGNTRNRVGSGEGSAANYTKLPHKTVATHAGLGWIGKCALLITRQFGSGIRISSILTDAPLETASPITTSRCGNCHICKDICPADAVSGKNWYAGLPRDEFWDAAVCRKKGQELSEKGFGNADAAICGRCILKCPWTQKAL